jgi:hypothetical protein
LQLLQKGITLLRLCVLTVALVVAQIVIADELLIADDD